MVRMIHDKGSILFELILKAVGIGASEMEVEYEDGSEEVCAFKDRMGIEIARLKSGSEEAVSLRNELYRIGKKKLRVNLSGADYELKVNVFESFGENAFRVKIRRI